MNKHTPVVTQFSSDKLNQIGAELIELYKGAKADIRQAKQAFESATHKRWKCGQIVANSIDIIENETTQREFAEKLGITEAMVSNDKRAFLALKEEGAESWEDAKQILTSKEINPVTKNWEKLPKLLSQPKHKRERDRRAKDEKQIERLWEEAEEIEQRQLNQNKNIAEEAKQVKRHIEHLHNHIKKQNPINLEWEKEGYLEYIRTFGKDMLTGEAVSPDERLEPHHINPFTGQASGGVGNKLADVWTIPTLLKNHRLDHSKDSPFNLDDYKDALLKTMATFIIENY